MTSKTKISPLLILIALFTAHATHTKKVAGSSGAARFTTRRSGVQEGEFRTPVVELAPFWFWNDDMEAEEMERQLRAMVSRAEPFVRSEVQRPASSYHGIRPVMSLSIFGRPSSAIWA